jgi:UDP-glucuronate 4-epimerase
MEKKVLLTGACGFVGWKTALLLLEQGYSVIGIDNLNAYYDPKLKGWRLEDITGGKYGKNFKFAYGDIEERRFLKDLFADNKFHAVINLAARAGVRYSLIDPYVYMSTNAMGTLNLLELCREYGCQKFVLASTSSLYAGQPVPFTEDLPVNTPISPYAASKKSAEALSYTYHYLYSLDVTVLRYFTVYGPAGRPDMSIFRFIKWIGEGKPIEIFGDGTQKRDFTYIDDVALGTLKAMEAQTGYEIINIGNNSPHELNNLIGLIEKELGKKAARETRPFHKADMKETWAEIARANRILNWRPSTSLGEGVEKTIKWHLANHDWLANIKL